MARDIMNAVEVAYVRSLPPGQALPRCAVIRHLGEGEALLRRLQRLIEEQEIDSVILVGPNVCTGWRIGVDRVVNFKLARSRNPEHQREIDQAAFRIVCNSFSKGLAW